MKDLERIAELIKALRKRPEPAAIATLVAVKGSSYRRAGARLLVTQSGRSAGGVSAGCLEADVAAHAQRVIKEGAASVVVYDDTHDSRDGLFSQQRGSEGAVGDASDSLFGLGMGCGGTVTVVIEPFDPAESLADWLLACADGSGSNAAAAVAFSQPSLEPPPKTFVETAGTVALLFPDGHFHADTADEARHGLLRDDLTHAVAENSGFCRSYVTCNGAFEVFVDVVSPPLRLLICGAGDDALPLYRMARELGWRVRIADFRPHLLATDRFPEATAIPLRSFEDAGAIAVDASDAVVVMTHRYTEDRALLAALLPARPAYLGLIGARSRVGRLLDDLRIIRAIDDATDLSALHAPAGLDIGGDGPEAIALAVTVEIMATRHKHPSRFLSARPLPFPEAGRGALDTSDGSHSAERWPDSDPPSPFQGEGCGEVAEDSSKVGVALILLAAGSSSRLERPKQLLPYRETTLLRHAALTAMASKCAPVVVVLGFDAPLMSRELDNLPVTVVENSCWTDGLSSSIKCGMQAVPATATAVVVMLCDQPLVTTLLLNRLVAEHQAGAPIAAAGYAGIAGVPAIFDRRYFAALSSLSGSSGARSIISADPTDVVTVPFPEAAIDIDTPADLTLL